MTDASENLRLPYIISGQAQKHITHNEALQALDALVQLSVASRSLALPPSAPAPGSRYLVASGAGGAWVGQAGRIAAFQAGAWLFYPPQPGWQAWIADEARLLVLAGGEWMPAVGSGAPVWGINAAADLDHRLAVASPASLFTHAGGDHRLTVDKAAPARTASLVLTSGHSGRAELGLAGDDDLHVKVSADGTTWREALRIDRATGAVLPVQGLRFPGYWRFFSSTNLLVVGNPSADVVLDTASHNPGNAYNPQTGLFTAPSAGLYFVNINFNTDGANKCLFDVEVNGVPVTRVEFLPNGYSHLSKTFLVALAEGEAFRLKVKEGCRVRFDGLGQNDNVVLLRLGNF